MTARAPSRTFSEAALDQWLERLGCDWEIRFSDAALQAGQQLYRRGQIRSIELSPDDAIVHGVMDQTECYAIVSWNGDGPHLRGSLKDQAVLDAIAVAGLYEIEELVAQESQILGLGLGLPESDVRNPVDAPDVAALNECKRTCSNGQRQKCEKTETATDAGTERRELWIYFELDTRGLRFRARWRSDDSTGPQTALENNHELEPRNGAERAKLIQLSTRARRSGFSREGSDDTFRFGDLGLAPRFVREDLPAWQKQFTLENPEILRPLLEGIHDAVFRVHVEGDGSGLDLELTGEVGDSTLEDGQTRLLLNLTTELTFLPRVGLVRVDSQRRDSASALRDRLRTAANGRLPAYLFASLLTDPELKLQPAPELLKWFEDLCHPEAITELPAFLRAYQKEGVQWLVHLCERGCHPLLADDMGLGKTVQILTLMATRPVAAVPSLIVCPASVTSVWQGEMGRFFPQLRSRIVCAESGFGEDMDSELIWIASYTQLRRHKAAVSAMRFGYAVLDEAHFIKNPDAKITQACNAIDARHRIALTGTPVENRIRDIWTLFRFLMPGLLGTRTRFERQFGNSNPASAARVQRQLAPFILRRTKDQVLDELPPKMETNLICPMTEAQRSEYNRLLQSGLEKWSEPLNSIRPQQRIGLLALLTRLRQAACHAALLPGVKPGANQSGKMTVLAEKLQEIALCGRRAVVFSQFTSFLDLVETMVREQFPSVARFRLDGTTRDRKSVVSGFQNTTDAAVIFVSLKAGGTGITLTNADYAFLLDPWWNPAVERQAVDRIHRIGQSRRVFVFRLVSQHSIEERVLQLQQSKDALFANIVDAPQTDGDWIQRFRSLGELLGHTPPGNASVNFSQGGPKADGTADS